MAKSALKHPLAVLRQICGINQFELAELANISPSMVQSIEVGRKRLSEGFAMEIAAVTGVDAVWLLRGDPTAPPSTPTGFGFTSAHFRDARNYKAIARDPRILLSAKVDAETSLKEIVPRLNVILQAASKMNRFNLAKWKLDKFLANMESTFECGKKGRKAQSTR